VFLIFTAGAVK